MLNLLILSLVLTLNSSVLARVSSQAPNIALEESELKLKGKNLKGLKAQVITRHEDNDELNTIDLPINIKKKASSKQEIAIITLPSVSRDTKVLFRLVDNEVNLDSDMIILNKVDSFINTLTNDSTAPTLNEKQGVNLESKTIIGDDGEAGLSGLSGPPGPVGLQGDIGPIGDKGAKGLAGKDRVHKHTSHDVIIETNLSVVSTVTCFTPTSNRSINIDGADSVKFFDTHSSYKGFFSDLTGGRPGQTLTIFFDSQTYVKFSKPAGVNQISAPAINPKSCADNKAGLFNKGDVLSLIFDGTNWQVIK